MTAKLTFWFELASTYAYLSAMRIETEAKARGVTVEWKPFLLGPVFKSQGWDTTPFIIYPAKGKYMWRDVERRCERLGLPFKKPDAALLEGFPRHTIAAARLALVGLESDWGKAFVRALYTAEWSEHRDIGDAAVLADLLALVGADIEAAKAAANTLEIKLRLRKNTERAQELGLFGAPSFTVRNELFWGDDRLEDALDWACAGIST